MRFDRVFFSFSGEYNVKIAADFVGLWCLQVVQIDGLKIMDCE